MKNRQCEEVGYIDKGFGKHQSNTVYSGGGVTMFVRRTRSQVLDTVARKAKETKSINW